MAHEEDSNDTDKKLRDEPAEAEDEVKEKGQDDSCLDQLVSLLKTELSLTQDSKTEDDEQKSTDKVDKRENADSKKLLIAEIKELLHSHKYFPNWKTFDDEETFVKFGKIVLDVHTAKLRTEYLSEMKYTALELISTKLTQLYLAIYFKKDNISKITEEAEHIIEICFDECNQFVPQLYKGAVSYVLAGLRAFHSLQLLETGSNVFAVEQLESVKHGLKQWDELTVYEQVGVLGIQQYFVGQMQKGSFQTQLDIISQMVKMDPSNPEWHYLNCAILRLERRASRNQSNQNQPPSSAEIHSISTTVKLDNATNPWYMMTLCNIMAELVQFHHYERSKAWNESLDFGLGKHFYCPEQMVQFLSKEVRRILAWCPTSVWGNISAAEIYSKVLPYKHRDLNFAKLCMERALLFHPESSKALTRMAIFSMVEEKNFAKAEEYLRRSFAADSRNFPALIELLQLYLSPEIENGQDKFYELIETELQNPDWDDTVLSQLLLLKGLADFAYQRTEDGVDSWVLSFQLKPDVLLKYIGRFSSLSRRYQWPQDLTDISRIKTIFEAILLDTASKSDEDTKTLKNIWSELCKMSIGFSNNDVQGGNRGQRGGRGQYQRGGGSSSSFGNSRGANQYLSREPRGGSRGRGGGGGRGRGGSRVDSDSSWRPTGSTSVQETGKQSDPYEVLGLRPGASQNEVLAAYNGLCMPRNGGSGGRSAENSATVAAGGGGAKATLSLNHEKMLEINEAFEKLHLLK